MRLKHAVERVLYGIIALIVMQSGVGWVERLMPPIVTGAVVAAIGLNLAPVAVKSVSGSSFDSWIGLLTVLIVGLVAVAAPGMWRRLPIIFGAIGGYLLYLLLANGFGMGKPIDFAALAGAAWIGLPKFTGPSFHADAMFLIAPVSLGHCRQTATTSMGISRVCRRLPLTSRRIELFGEACERSADHLLEKLFSDNQVRF